MLHARRQCILGQDNVPVGVHIGGILQQLYDVIARFSQVSGNIVHALVQAILCGRRRILRLLRRCKPLGRRRCGKRIGGRLQCIARARKLVGGIGRGGKLAALPPEVLSRLILPLGDFAPEDVAEMAVPSSSSGAFSVYSCSATTLLRRFSA